MVSLSVNGQPIEVAETTTILKAAEELNIRIPTLCYHPLMEPYAACRVCVVEVVSKGHSELVTACNTQVREGIEVKTDSPRAVEARGLNLELLMAQAPAAQIVRDLAAELGIKESRFPIRDGENKCILCGMCVRACEEIAGAYAISFVSRGIDRLVTVPFERRADDCILCGACAYFCPTGHIRMSDFDQIIHSQLKLGPNSAISMPFRQAIPNVPRIQTEHCIHFKTGACMLCSKVCPKECIHYDDQDETEEAEIGAVIIASGFQDFDPAPLKQYGYGKYPNVLSAIEFEQMNNAGSPTGGKILMQNGQEPRSVAILHCIGSRDENTHDYCSRVCCMYALKFAHLIFEKTSAEVYQLYIEMRAFGKGYQEFYKRILSEGVNLIRGKGTEIVATSRERMADGALTVRCEDTLIGKFREIPVDMVVLCTAMEARKDAAELGRKFNISVGADGWYIESHPKLGPVTTTTEGIFLAGVCQGPKDIPDTVAQGGAAAAHTLKMLTQGQLLMDAAYAEIAEEFCSGCRICNGLCPYNAITFDETKKVSNVNSAMCKACGTCVAACPTGAITARHFTDEQIYAQIEGILV
jgi:heterodisulfide reductase subunit A